MKGTNKGLVLALSWVAFLATRAAAEPSYLVYPNAPAVFRFDTGRYELIPPSDPNYMASYAVGNQMLWDRAENRVPLEIYRAPELIGFEPSTNGTNEFVTFRNEFEVVVDGFGPSPHTLGNLHLRFWPEPANADVEISLNGQPYQRLTALLPALDVVTPLETGYYSDTSTVMFSWAGASVMRVIAFSDKDGDGAFQGTATFGIVAINAVVPVAPTTWGRIKSMYR